MIGQKRARTAGTPPTLIEMETDGTMKTIESQTETKLLGATVQDNITWNAHIDTGAEALLPDTRKTLGIIRYVGKTMPSSSRKLVTEGLILSKMRYLISIWGVTSDKNISNAQTLLNDAARFITGRNTRTSTYEQMNYCKILTISEMSTHSSLTQLWKTIRLKSPKSMSNKISID